VAAAAVMPGHSMPAQPSAASIVSSSSSTPKPRPLQRPASALPASGSGGSRQQRWLAAAACQALPDDSAAGAAKSQQHEAPARWQQQRQSLSELLCRQQLLEGLFQQCFPDFLPAAGQLGRRPGSSRQQQRPAQQDGVSSGVPDASVNACGAQGEEAADPGLDSCTRSAAGAPVACKVEGLEGAGAAAATADLTETEHCLRQTEQQCNSSRQWSSEASTPAARRRFEAAERRPTSPPCWVRPVAAASESGGCIPTAAAAPPCGAVTIAGMVAPLHGSFPVRRQLHSSSGSRSVQQHHCQQQQQQQQQQHHQRPATAAATGSSGLSSKAGLRCADTAAVMPRPLRPSSAVVTSPAGVFSGRGVLRVRSQEQQPSAAAHPCSRSQQQQRIGQQSGRRQPGPDVSAACFSGLSVRAWTSPDGSSSADGLLHSFMQQDACTPGGGRRRRG
jgi:hypothetical protein